MSGKRKIVWWAVFRHRPTLPLTLREPPIWRERIYTTSPFRRNSTFSPGEAGKEGGRSSRHRLTALPTFSLSVLTGLDTHVRVVLLVFAVQQVILLFYNFTCSLHFCLRKKKKKKILQKKKKKKGKRKRKRTKEKSKTFFFLISVNLKEMVAGWWTNLFFNINIKYLCLRVSMTAINSYILLDCRLLGGGEGKWLIWKEFLKNLITVQLFSSIIRNFIIVNIDLRGILRSYIRTCFIN